MSKITIRTSIKTRIQNFKHYDRLKKIIVDAIEFAGAVWGAWELYKAATDND